MSRMHLPQVFSVAASVSLAVGVLSACASHAAIRPGGPHTIANAQSTGKRDRSIDWPCFRDLSDYKAWLSNAGDKYKQSLIEEKSALLLEPGNTVTIQHIVEPDTLQVRILTDPVNDTDGLTCWTPGYDGKLFSK
ncbi:MAG: hypothetical protein WCB01_16320 [Candidatus Cybelea sp.]